MGILAHQADCAVDVGRAAGSARVAKKYACFFCLFLYFFLSFFIFSYFFCFYLFSTTVCCWSSVAGRLLLAAAWLAAARCQACCWRFKIFSLRSLKSSDFLFFVILKLWLCFLCFSRQRCFDVQCLFCLFCFFFFKQNWASHTFPHTRTHSSHVWHIHTLCRHTN